MHGPASDGTRVAGRSFVRLVLFRPPEGRYESCLEVEAQPSLAEYQLMESKQHAHSAGAGMQAFVLRAANVPHCCRSHVL